MTTANQTRRQVMLTAWGLCREGRQLQDGRTFGECLAGAWRHIKRAAAKAAFAAMRLVRLSPSLIRSPIQRAAGAERYARAVDWCAAPLTTRVGW